MKAYEEECSKFRTACGGAEVLLDGPALRGLRISAGAAPQVPPVSVVDDRGAVAGAREASRRLSGMPFLDGSLDLPKGGLATSQLPTGCRPCEVGKGRCCGSDAAMVLHDLVRQTLMDAPSVWRL